MRSPTVPDPRSGHDSPTARSRIRSAALELFAERGVDRTTVRAIAVRAEVSPALVLHHYTSKQGLRSEVDASVAARLLQALAAPAPPAADPLDRLVRAITALLTEPYVLDYLRRVWADAGPAGQVVFDRLLAMAAQALAEETEAPAGDRVIADPTYAAARVLFVLLGEASYGPLLERHIADLHDHTRRAERAAETRAMLRRMIRP